MRWLRLARATSDARLPPPYDCQLPGIAMNSTSRPEAVVRYVAMNGRSRLIGAIHSLVPKRQQLPIPDVECCLARTTASPLGAVVQLLGSALNRPKCCSYTWLSRFAAATFQSLKSRFRTFPNQRLSSLWSDECLQSKLGDARQLT